jgi:signal peptidase II
MRNALSLRLTLLVAIVATMGCDRVTKHLAVTILAGVPSQSFLHDTVRLEYAENAGGFLSLGTGLSPALRTVVFTVGTGLALLALIAAAIPFRWNGWALIGVGLFVAGGASNWLDRIARGHVVDFLNVGVGSLRTGIFNVADMAIMMGIALIAFAEFERDGRTRHSGLPRES